MKNEFTTLKESDVKMYNHNEHIYSELELMQKELNRWRKLALFLLFIIAVLILTVVADSFITHTL